eukprot:2936361-Pyramimonas_sp.AAC.1
MATSPGRAQRAEYITVDRVVERHGHNKCTISSVGVALRRCRRRCCAGAASALSKRSTNSTTSETHAVKAGGDNTNNAC